MQRLWSPWRSEYVSAATPAGGDCIFCAYPRQANDRANLLVHRGERAFVLLNRYPYNPGHLMVAPYEHSGDLAALPSETASELMSLLQRSLRVLAETYGPDGCNAGLNLGSAAGAGIADHLHIHVVPRWSGDTNFMPTVGDVKVIPERLAESYEKLAAAFQGQGDAGRP